MNIKFLVFIVVGLFFPTFSLLNIGNFPILRVDFISQILLLFYSFVIGMGRIKIQKEAVSIFILVVVLYILMNGINLMYYDDFNYFKYFKISIQTFIIFGICFLILNLNLSRFSLLRFYRFISLIGFLISLYAIYQIISWNIIELPYSSLVFNSPQYSGISAISEFGGFIRPTSIFKEPGYLAFFLQMIVVIGFFSNKYNYDKELNLNFFKKMIVVVAFISTISLFSYISLFIVCFIFFKKNTMLMLVPALVLVLLIVEDLGPLERVLNFLRIIFIEQDLSLSDGSFNLRLGRIYISLLIFFDNLWIGVGLYNIENHTALYTLGDWYKYDNNFVFSNFFIFNALAETGIAGVFALISMFVFMFKKLKYKKIKNKNLRFSAHLSTALLFLFIINQDLPLSTSYRLIYLILIFIAINKISSYKKGKYAI